MHLQCTTCRTIQASCKCLHDLSKKVHKFQRNPQTLQHETPRDKAHNTENEDRWSCTHVHKTTNRFKSSSQDNHFQRVPNCLTTVWQLFHKHPQVSKFSSNYMDTSSKTVDNTQNNNKTKNKLWSSAAGIFHVTIGHLLNPITATSLDHTSTLVQNNQ